MRRFLLNILLSATLFAGCSDQVLDYDSLEEFIQENNIPSSQIIYYTTNDGSVVSVNSYIGNAEVIGNRYEYGRGVIVCDKTITSIGNSAFRNCDGLTSITIPNSVTSIGNQAFFSCDGLTIVYCKATTQPTLGGSYAFYSNVSSRKIYVPRASVSAYKSASGWSAYASSIVGYDF